MNKGRLICAIGLIIIFAPQIFGMFYMEEIIVGEQLCVDGNNNINLEGIMCEKTEYNVLGIGFGWYMLFVMLLVFFGLMIFISGLRYDNSVSHAFSEVEDSK